MAQDAPGHVVRGAVERALATVVDIGATRLELASVELEEERLRLAQLAFAAAGVLFFAFAALTALAVALVLWCPVESRPAVLVGVGAVAAAVAAACAWRWRRLQATRRPLLQATIAELQADGAALRGTGATNGPGQP
jgi:uncharacterized membrane protein YqjE